MDPMIPDANGLPEGRILEGTLTFTYPKIRQDVTYIVETTSSLDAGGWTTVGVNQGIPDANNRVTASIPIGPSTGFLRLSVRIAP